MKKIVLNTLSLGVLTLSALQTSAQTVTVDPTTLTDGYMNWSPEPGDAAGYGGSGSSGWGVSALQANFSGSTLTIQPNVNTYDGVGDNYWVNADGTGANLMDANVYNETTGTYVGTTLTFTFDVLSDTLPSGFTSVGFIKDFASDYSSYTESSIALAPGIETISLLTSASAGDHIQYGFETMGPDTNPSSAAALDSAVISPVVIPEPATWAWAGSSSVLLLSLFRRRNK